MFNILILGKGFIGTHLYNHLSKYNSPVTFVNKAALDYSKENELLKFLNYKKFDYVVNCSGYTGIPNVDSCETNKEECYNYNVTIPTVIAKCCEMVGNKLINISSGCIYTGYEKEFTEQDLPNFGIFNSSSSFYSKTKHTCETILNNFNALTLRIRMPISNDNNRKNLVQKILNYSKLISLDNSATHLDDLSDFIFKLFNHKDIYSLRGPLNVVNPGSINCKKIANLILELNSEKKILNKLPNWEFVDISKLDIKTGRSNCILSDSKIQSLNLGLRPIDSILKDTVEQVLLSNAQSI